MRISPILFAFPILLFACTPAAPGGSSSSSSSAESSVSSVAQTFQYEDAGIGYSIDVPSGWTTVEDKEVVTDLYQTKGTAFVTPAEAGTTLDEAFFHVAQLASCPALRGSTAVTIAGATFQRSPWTGAGAGNLYEGVTFAGPKDAGCLILTGYIHSCNLGADCGENHSAPFGKEALLSKFEAMAQSVKFLEHPGN